MPIHTSPGVARQPGLLILDTGAIRELVLFHAVSVYEFESLRTSLRFIRHLESYNRCSQFLSSFRHLTTSASVVGELYHWIRETDRNGQARLWRRVYEEFRNMRMDEEVVRLLDMDIDFVSRFGPVDGSILELARRAAGRNPLILTTDFPLYGECRKAGLNVSHIHEITLAGR